MPVVLGFIWIHELISRFILNRRRQQFVFAIFAAVFFLLAIGLCSIVIIAKTISNGISFAVFMLFICGIGAAMSVFRPPKPRPRITPNWAKRLCVISLVLFSGVYVYVLGGVFSTAIQQARHTEQLDIFIMQPDTEGAALVKTVRPFRSFYASTKTSPVFGWFHFKGILAIKRDDHFRLNLDFFSASKGDDQNRWKDVHVSGPLDEPTPIPGTPFQVLIRYNDTPPANGGLR